MILLFCQFVLLYLQWDNFLGIQQNRDEIEREKRKKTDTMTKKKEELTKLILQCQPL